MSDLTGTAPGLREHPSRGTSRGTQQRQAARSSCRNRLPETSMSHPETASGAHFFLGRIANQEGDSTEAVRELRLALEGDPNYADAHAELGRVHLNRKE